MRRTGFIAERGPQHAYTAGEDPFADSPARPDPLDETLPGNDFTGFFDQHDQHVHHFRLQMHGIALDDQTILVWTDLSVPQPDRFQLDLTNSDADNSGCDGMATQKRSPQPNSRKTAIRIYREACLAIETNRANV